MLYLLEQAGYTIGRFGLVVGRQKPSAPQVKNFGISCENLKPWLHAISQTLN